MENFSDKGNRKSLELADDASTDDSRREQPSVLGTPRTESISTEWTDEKHSLYLKSMETSFINELYKSAKFISSPSQKDYSTNVQASKFKVLRRGCWQRIVFEGEKPLLSRPLKNFGYQGVLGNPWIQHFRSSKIQTVETFPNHEENEESTSDQAINLRRADSENSKPSTYLSKQSHIGYLNLCQNSLAGSDIEEVSDQNFVDEDSEEVNACKSLFIAKEITLEVEARRNDQVVPCGRESRGVVDERIVLFNEETS